MGASNRTFAEACEKQKLHAWIECHVHAFEYMRGVPRVVVPDQPRTSITKACRYDPELTLVYRELAQHYSTCIIPARPKSMFTPSVEITGGRGAGGWPLSDPGAAFPFPRLSA